MPAPRGMPAVSPDVLFAIGAGVVGLAIGSFLNVVIHRLPKMMERDWRAQCAELEGRAAADTGAYNLWMPLSQCPACAAPLRLRDNVPLLSYFALRGRCHACRAPIAARYPLVEALTGVLSVWIALHFGFGAPGLLALTLTWALIALTFIDLDTTLLPDDITLPLLWGGLLVNLWGVFAPLEQAVIGAIAGYGSLWSVFWLFKLATGKEGMGYGDFKLLAALGAWLGWKMLLPIILFASVVGALVGVALMLAARAGRSTAIPFGPYLAAAGFLASMYGAWLNSRVLGL